MRSETVAFKTLGCKVNQYETQQIRERFTKKGFKEVSKDSPADIYVINTCTVTEKSDAESRRLIRKFARERPNSKIIVTGCFVELDSDTKTIENLAENVLIIKNSQKSNILQHLTPGDTHSNTKKYLSPQYEKVSGTFPIGESVPIEGFEGRSKVFVKVQDGCDNFCSYCKVPVVRGRSRSRNPEGILKEVESLVSKGYKEVILTGICLGDWGRHINLNLSWLLNEVQTHIHGNFRIRLSSLEPWYVSEELIKIIANSDKICRHLHIPMQSGDDEILEKMNRHFSSKEFLNLINKARDLIPEVAFTTDILLGFPGEGETSFKNTEALTRVTKPSRAHIFPFSRREGTKAYSLTDCIQSNTVTNRVSNLRKLTDSLSEDYANSFAGKTEEVLVETNRNKENMLIGYTDTYIKVAFQGPDTLKGQITRLTLTNPSSCDILASHF